MRTLRKKLRVYVDNSVASGMFDHIDQTKPFWNAVVNEKITIIVSDILLKEVADAPEYVREFFTNLPKSQIEIVESTKESDDLASAYIDAGVITRAHIVDCKHIALATINRADYLVSWNFRHIVNANKIHGYNGINVLHEYPTIDIVIPYILINGEENNDEEND